MQQEQRDQRREEDTRSLINKEDAKFMQALLDELEALPSKAPPEESDSDNAEDDPDRKTESDGPAADPAQDRPDKL